VEGFCFVAIYHRSDMQLVASGHSFPIPSPTHPRTAEAFRGRPLWGKGGFASGRMASEGSLVSQQFLDGASGQQGPAEPASGDNCEGPRITTMVEFMYVYTCIFIYIIYLYHR